MSKRNCGALLVVILISLVVDLEVTELVGVLVRRDDTEPVTKAVLLQVLLRQVLEVTARIIK